MAIRSIFAAATLAAGLMASSALAADMTVGFSQIGSESGWRAAETSVTKQQAEKRGIDLKFADAQQKQENQIKAIRSFIAQGVDAILLAPVVETGWDQVLGEAKDAEIPVVLLDRNIKAPEDLYLTAVTSDQVHEGKVAGDWLVKTVGDKKCNVVELQGTTGSSPAINRKKGFEEAIDGHDNIKIIRSQTGDFTRTKGKEVMESFLKAENGGKDICALYAHNDDMAVGAIQAIKEAGLKPGSDILVVSIDCGAGHLQGDGGRRGQRHGRADAEHGRPGLRRPGEVQEGRHHAAEVDPDRVQALHPEGRPDEGRTRRRRTSATKSRTFR